MARLASHPNQRHSVLLTRSVDEPATICATVAEYTAYLDKQLKLQEQRRRAEERAKQERAAKRAAKRADKELKDRQALYAQLKSEFGDKS